MNVPAVPSSSLIKGSAPEFFKNPLDFLSRAQGRYGSPFRFRAGPKWFYVFSHPDHAREIFSKSHTSFCKEQNTALVLGQSLLTSDADVWVRQRRHSQKYFSKDQLGSLFGITHETIVKRVDTLTAFARSSEKLRVHDFCVDTICDLVTRLLFKAEPRDEFSQIARSVDEMTDFIRRRSSSVIKLPLWVPTPANRRFNKAKKDFEAFIRPIHEEASQAGRENLLHMLSSDPECTPKELYNEALTFFVAGFETTANALFWTLDSLAKNPQARAKLREEVKAIDRESIQGFEDLNKLPWTRACVMESLRLYPVAWFRSKLAAKDETVSGFDIPKGAVIWVCLYLTHRNSEFWSNPENFLPERFLPPNSEPSSPFAYIPFGGGRTICIGREMAVFELMLILFHFFKRFDFEEEAHPKIDPIASITLRPSREWEARLRN